jgi:hypothetical protein
MLGLQSDFKQNNPELHDSMLRVMALNLISCQLDWSALCHLADGFAAYYNRARMLGHIEQSLTLHRPLH